MLMGAQCMCAQKRERVHWLAFDLLNALTLFCVTDGTYQVGARFEAIDEAVLTGPSVLPCIFFTILTFSKEPYLWPLSNCIRNAVDLNPSKLFAWWSYLLCFSFTNPNPVITYRCAGNCTSFFSIHCTVVEHTLTPFV